MPYMSPCHCCHSSVCHFPHSLFSPHHLPILHLCILSIPQHHSHNYYHQTSKDINSALIVHVCIATSIYHMPMCSFITCFQIFVTNFHINGLQRACELDVTSTSVVFMKPWLKCKPDIALFAVKISVCVYKMHLKWSFLIIIITWFTVSFISHIQFIRRRVRA